MKKESLNKKFTNVLIARNIRLSSLGGGQDDF